MWKYLPPDGRANLAEDLLGCSSNADIEQLADSIVSGLLNLMQAFWEAADNSTNTLSTICVGKFN